MSKVVVSELFHWYLPMNLCSISGQPRLMRLPIFTSLCDLLLCVLCWVNPTCSWVHLLHVFFCCLLSDRQSIVLSCTLSFDSRGQLPCGLGTFMFSSSLCDSNTRRAFVHCNTKTVFFRMLENQCKKITTIIMTTLDFGGTLSYMQDCYNRK